MTGTFSGSDDAEPGRVRPASRFEVDTDRLRAAASRLAGLRDRLAGPRSDNAELDTGPVDPGLAGTGLAGTGLSGWSCESVLARLDEDWAAAVDSLVTGYADHADQLRAAAERYEDVERIVRRALDEAAD